MIANKVKSLFGLLLAIYIASPIVFKYSPFIQRSLLFMNHVNTQYKFNLSHPEQLGIKCSRLLRLKHSVVVDSYGSSSHPSAVGDVQEVELGGWHILPESTLASCITTHHDNRTFIDDKLAFIDSRPIVLYVHGNGGNRAGDHRGRLYRRLAYEHDYHIITFDYRGYGDSTYLQPTADGLSSDAKTVYRWLLKQPNVTKDRVIVWGHSLGTAVSVKMLSELSDDIRPKGLVLEAPFDSVANAIANHPFSMPFRVIPYFEYFFVEPVEKSADMNFDSAKKITDLRSTPILILHAEDDGIIPLKLGQNLYSKAVNKLGDSMVKLITIDAKHGLGHKHICNHEDTMGKVRHFIDEL